MRRVVLCAAVAVLTACPGPSGTDGGTGGGGGTTGGGGGTTGGGGGTTGGGGGTTGGGGGTTGGGGGTTGGGGGTTGGGGGGTLTLDQLCGMIFSVECNAFVTCGAFSTTQGCQAYFDQFAPADPCSSQRAAIHDGRMTFDSAAASACVNGLGSTCDFNTSDCQHVFVGQVAAGGDCFSKSECVSTAYCDTSNMVCPGKCFARGASGDFVPNSSDCLDGLGGNYETGPDGGFAFHCAPLSTQGQACSSSGACAAGLYCSMDTGHCEAKAALGGSCASADGGSNSEACNSQQWNTCLHLSAGASPTCEKPRGPGEYCEPGTCKLDLRCSVTDAGSSCGAPGTVGDSCTPFTQGDCAIGLYCNYDFTSGTGACANPGQVGEPCSAFSNNSCVAGAVCNGMQPSDGGFTPEYRCVASDGGTSNMGCVDPTP